MLASVPIALARDWLGDSVAPYRWSDLTLMGYLEAAEVRVCSLRPEVLLSAPGSLLSRADIDPAAAPAAVTMTAADEFSHALAAFVVARALSRDLEEGNIAKAQTFEALFMRELGLS